MMTESESFSAFDRQCMSRALELAAKGRFTTTPNPNVGCVIAAPDQSIVGEGFHAVAGSAHAEVHALQAAGSKAAGATAYVTLEPCSHTGRTPPCADALIRAGVARVVVAMQDPFHKVAGRGIARLRDAGIQVDIGLLAEQAAELNRGFIKRALTGMPYVRVKLAQSLDGRTALANGHSRWVTGAEAREDVQLGRASSDAILTGAATVLCDDPLLNVRLDKSLYPQGLDVRQPVRVVVDNKAQIHRELRLWEDSAPVWLVRPEGSRAELSSAPAPLPDNALYIDIPQAADERIDLKALLKTLAEHDIQTIWVEAGPRLAGALLAQQLVDELIVYIAPKLMGPDARPLLDLPLHVSMETVPVFSFSEVSRVGDDIKLVAHLAKSTPV